jgi:hypothetical protein
MLYGSTIADSRQFYDALDGEFSDIHPSDSLPFQVKF